ncbi:MAG: glutathione synthase [Holosporales bacterium]
MKPLGVVAVMDPMAGINPETDTTFALMREAQHRGHRVFYVRPDDIRLDNKGVSAWLAAVTLYDARPPHHAVLGAAFESRFEDIDVVLIRHDPPYDMRYLTPAYMLEFLPSRILCINDPRSIRDCPEKILPLRFPDLLPKTLISRDSMALRAFWEQQGTAVLKPLYHHGGAGVFVLKAGDTNFNSMVEILQDRYAEPLIIQQYLPAVRQGDKRILLLDGEPLGCIARIPKDDESRANLHAGGTAEHRELTLRDHEICRTLAPFLRERGLFFVGIDVIGDYLTEINVTSPTVLPEMELLSGNNLRQRVWQAIEAK